MTRHFLNLKDLSSKELEGIILHALSLKKENSYSKELAGKYLALIFEKASTRTRISFEVAMNRLGGVASFLPTSDLHLGKRESLEDTSRAISSMADAIVLRTISHKTIERFASVSSIPVINGLSELSHPCQLLADIMTFYECNGDIKDKKVTWVGDCNNMFFSYMEASELMGFKLSVACPKGFWPTERKVLNSNVNFTEDLNKAAEESDLITTDVWVSMGDEEESKERMKAFKSFQVRPELMKLAKKNAIFLHCLPAIRGQEISENMLEHPRSKVWQQAENRVHAQKSLLLFLLKKSL